MQKYILIGDSGHAKVIQDCIASTGGQVIAKLDDKYTEENVQDNFIVGPIALINQLLKGDIQVIISIGNNSIRKRIVERLDLPLEIYGTVIHSSCILSKTAKIGKGTVIMPGVVINADVEIGNHAIINSNSTVEHDCSLADYVHISPGATLTGNVNVQIGSQIGAGATIIPGIEVGKWCTVGAGSTVITNIASNLTVVGSPAKAIKKEGTSVD